MNNLEICSIRSEIEVSAKTSRSFNDYCDFFGFKPEDFNGKRILDVGAGKSRFSAVAQELGAQVVEIDAEVERKKGIN